MRRLALIALVAVACHHAPPAPRVYVHVTCSDDHARDLEVDGERVLDASVCGAAWDSLGIAHGPRTELVRAVAGREAWLLQRDGRAVVELRAHGAVTASFDGVTELDIYPSLAAPTGGPATLAIAIAGTTRQVPLDELRRRLASSGGGRDLSICALADAYAPASTQLAITGEAPQPVIVPRAQCESRGLVLRFSSRGDVRLRGPGGAHVLQHVRAIAL